MGLLRLLRLVIWGSPRTIRAVPTQEASYQPAFKAKAQSEVSVRAEIQYLPRATVINVIDGDTVIVARSGRDGRVRLDSIDCPEDGQDWGDTAKFGLIKLIGGRDVQLEEHGMDDHGRILATVYVWHSQKRQWFNVNERMVMLGHAWVMRRFYDHLPKDRQQKLDRLERWARSKRVGLWRKSNPTPPWRWREGDVFGDDVRR
jgi:micrococcal nuclease